MVQDLLDQGLIFVPHDQITKDQTDALWELGRTPIKVACLEKYLRYYPDSKTSLLLLDGFRNGFSLQYSGPRTPFISRNLKSAEMLKIETQSKLNKEITLGRMCGPFKNRPISTLRTSPIGLVNKSDGSFRLIMHLSFPSGCSVNDFVDPNETSVKYTSFDEVIDMVSSLGKGARLGVQDIKSAFRLLPISPGDFDLLGIYFDGNFYVDKSLPFGCSIACALFEKFSTFLHWLVVSSAGKHSVKHYLDDFIFGGSANSDDCLVLMNTFTELCNELGVPIAEDKTTHPTTRLTFLGLEIDTVDMVVRIPVAKLIKLRSQLHPMTIKRKIKFKDLESLVGLLAFCSRAVPSSRAFLRRFYDVIASFKVKKPFFSIRITSEIREDVLVWLEFLKSFNGDSYIIGLTWTDNDILQLYTDSAGNAELGCGSYFNGKWAQFKWPDSWVGLHILQDITFLELIPILLALCIWAPLLKNSKILFRTDNIALVDILNKRTSKSKRVMSIIRPFVLRSMNYNIQFKAKHIVGAKNNIADALSRFQLEKFKRLAPLAEDTPEIIPQEFIDLISKVKLTD